MEVSMKRLAFVSVFVMCATHADANDDSKWVAVINALNHSQGAHSSNSICSQSDGHCTKNWIGMYNNELFKLAEVYDPDNSLNSRLVCVFPKGFNQAKETCFSWDTGAGEQFILQGDTYMPVASSLTNPNLETKKGIQKAVSVWVGLQSFNGQHFDNSGCPAGTRNINGWCK